MKLISIVMLSLCCSLYSFSQDLDSRLLDRYSAVELTEMTENNPEEYKLLVYALDNAVYVTDFPKGKGTDFETIQITGDKIDFISLGLSIENRNQYYKIVGQDKLLVVKSRIVLKNENK